MNKKIISITLFVLVLATIGGLGGVLYKNVQVDTINESVLKQTTISLLFAFAYKDENDEDRITSFLVLLEPVVKQVGVLEIPPYLGVYDSDKAVYVPIDSYYKRKGYKEYYNVVSRELGIPEINYIFADTQMLGDFVDLMGGVKMFIIENEDKEVPFSAGNNFDSSRVGNANLDGPDVAQYIENVEISDNILLFKSSQRKEFILSLLRSFQRQSNMLSSKKIRRRLRKLLKTSLTIDNFENIRKVLSEYSLDSIFYQRINGNLTSVESVDGNEDILFVSSEVGSLIKITEFFEKQIKESAIQNAKNKVTITILNGTVINGLARRAKELYEAAGFQVLSIGNSIQNDISKTVLIDRTGNQVRVDLAAQVINARNVITDITSVDLAGSSITLILGEDFDGEKIR